MPLNSDTNASYVKHKNPITIGTASSNTHRNSM